jgi:RND family efflux transporter MFP subunit
LRCRLNQDGDQIKTKAQFKYEENTAMDEEKKFQAIDDYFNTDDYLNDDTDPALRSQRPPMHSRAVVPALREQLIPFRAESALQEQLIPFQAESALREQLIPLRIEPKQRDIQQDFVTGSVGEPQIVHPRKPSKLALVAICMLTLLFLGLMGLVCFREFFGVYDVTAFRVGQRKMVSQYIGGGGLIHPLQQVTISYPAPLQIVDVLVKEGDHVKQGQPLVKLDPDQVNAQVNQAQNDVNAAQSYVNTVSGSGNQVALAGANHTLEQAQNKLKTLQAQTSSILSGDQLVAPIQGVVTNLNASPGLQARANAALLAVIDQSSVIMRAKIPLENLSQVRLGMKALVTPSALPDQTFNGTVTAITPQADAETDTFEVDIQVNNAQQMLLGGMSAFVRIQGQVNAFVVPRLAVLNPDRESSVFEIRNGHAYLKAVHVVGRSANDVYVDDGLKNSDLIVLLPIQRVRQGQEVNVVSTER